MALELGIYRLPVVSGGHVSEVDDRVDDSPSTAYRQAVAKLNPLRRSATKIAEDSGEQVTRPTVSKVLRGDYTSWKKAEVVIRVLGHDPRDYEGYWAAAYGTHPSTEVIDLRNAGDELERQLKAANQQYSSQVRELEETLEQARNQAARDNAELDLARANWEQARADLEQAKAELERLKDNLTEAHEDHTEEIAAAQRTANVLETALQQRQQTLRARDIRIKELEEAARTAAGARSKDGGDESRIEELRVALAEERDQARHNTQVHEEELSKLRSSLTAENKLVTQKLDEARGKLANVQNELRKQRNASADAERRNDEAERRAKQDAARLASLRDKITELEAKIAEQRRELLAKDSVLKDLREQVKISTAARGPSSQQKLAIALACLTFSAFTALLTAGFYETSSTRSTSTPSYPTYSTYSSTYSTTAAPIQYAPATSYYYPTTSYNYPTTKPTPYNRNADLLPNTKIGPARVPLR